MMITTRIKQHESNLRAKVKTLTARPGEAITLAKLAEKIGTHRVNLSRWLNGHAAASPAFMDDVEQAVRGLKRND